MFARATFIFLPFILAALLFWNFALGKPREQKGGPAVKEEHDTSARQREDTGHRLVAQELDKEQAEAQQQERPFDQDEIKEDLMLLPKAQRLWFMLRRRGWQNETEIVRALDLLQRADALFAEIEKDYFLMWGSLIGHCRHEGFIPWDDVHMDMVAERHTVRWLVSEEGTRACAAHGLIPFLWPTGYVKLYHVGEDVPQAGFRQWGYPFLDVYPYDVDESTGLLQIHDEEPLPREYILPVRRVTFHQALPKGVLVPYQPGTVLDTFFPGWRTTCVLDVYNHHREDYDYELKGSCEVMTRFMGLRLAPPTRCPSASMLGL